MIRLTKKQRILCFPLAVIMMLLPVGICATSPEDSDDCSVYYSANEEEIFQKTELLGGLKAEAAAMRANWKSEEPIEGLIRYEELMNEIEAVRQQLITLGAKPDKETLSSLEFVKPMTVNGVLTDDFASFENTFDGAFDLWGVEKTVNTSYGTYYTYDLMIQDYAGNDKLAATLKQDGEVGYEIYIKQSSVSSFLVGRMDSLLFDKRILILSDNDKAKKSIYNGAQILSTVNELKDNNMYDDVINGDYVIKNKNMSTSYRIYCTTESTVHFIFVRSSASSPWQHTLTTNTVYLREKHYCYIAFSVGGGRIDDVSGEVDYSRTVFPDRYNYRLTDAITAYRNNKSLCRNVVDEYTVSAVKDGEYREIFTLDVVCPITQTDLIRCTVGRKFEPYLIIVGAVLAISAAAVVVMKRKKK